MLRRNNTPHKGFTLIELLVVIAIIGILASIVMMSLNDSRIRGRDGARKTQIQEILKSLELYYTDNKMYPTYGGGVDTGGLLSGIETNFYGSGRYLNRLPDEAGTNYYYCVSSDRRSIMLAVDTENDSGGSNFCSIVRGPGSNYGCNAWFTANASDSCTTRF